ncbi:GntR family transcriptional regulator [Shinella sp.]|uniref:GntR family transcriptional regulator n=1 Tax=Shinella sp. TaxID=1870904 RepID=UPI003F70D253
MANTKTATAYEAIKFKIIEGELQPLGDISEDSLQKELDLSRTPIREACQRLSKEGFIYIYPSKGMIVAEVTADLIRDIYEMRLLNEPFIAAQSCRQNSSKDWIKALREKLVNPPNDLSEEAKRRYFIDIDRTLHDGLLKDCKNRFLLSSMAIVLDHNHRIRIKVSHPYHGEDRSVLEHIDIIDAYLARDEAEVERQMRHHIEESRKITFNNFF